LEAVYQEALGIEFGMREIPFRREVELPIQYRDVQLQTFYRADFACDGTLIVETKALTQFSGTAEAQILNYLKATGFEVALLLNFGKSSLEHLRFANSKKKSAQSAESADVVQEY
jgi:GxxExxY protein